MEPSRSVICRCIFDSRALKARASDGGYLVAQPSRAPRLAPNLLVAAGLSMRHGRPAAVSSATVACTVAAIALHHRYSPLPNAAASTCPLPLLSLARCLAAAKPTFVVAACASSLLQTIQLYSPLAASSVTHAASLAASVPCGQLTRHCCRCCPAVATCGLFESNLPMLALCSGRV